MISESCETNESTMSENKELDKRFTKDHVIHVFTLKLDNIV